MRQTPEALPQAWSAGATPAELFNALQAGLESVNTRTVGEFYAIVLGEYVKRPDPNICPTYGNWIAARQQGQMAPKREPPEVVAYHHH